VFERVGQGLLDHPVRRHVDAAGDRVAVEVEPGVDVEPVGRHRERDHEHDVRGVVVTLELTKKKSAKTTRSSRPAPIRPLATPRA
jgi:hypothetical protein